MCSVLGRRPRCHVAFNDAVDAAAVAAAAAVMRSRQRVRRRPPPLTSFRATCYFRPRMLKRLTECPLVKATKVNAGPAESNGRLLLGIWRDSLHVTCGLTACTPGSAPGPTLGNEYGKTLPFYLLLRRCDPSNIGGRVYVRVRVSVRVIFSIT